MEHSIDSEKVIKGLEKAKMVIEQWIPMFEQYNTPAVIDEAIALLKEQETANLYKCPNCGTWVSAENVVRCKDCKYYDNFNGCMSWHDVNSNNDNWYCADGERRIDDD